MLHFKIIMLLQQKVDHELVIIIGEESSHAGTMAGYESCLV